MKQIVFKDTLKALTYEEALKLEDTMCKNGHAHTLCLHMLRVHNVSLDNLKARAKKDDLTVTFLGKDDSDVPTIMDITVDNEIEFYEMYPDYAMIECN